MTRPDTLRNQPPAARVFVAAVVSAGGALLVASTWRGSLERPLLLGSLLLLSACANTIKTQAARRAFGVVAVAGIRREFRLAARAGPGRGRLGDHGGRVGAVHVQRHGAQPVVPDALQRVVPRALDGTGRPRARLDRRRRPPGRPRRSVRGGLRARDIFCATRCSSPPSSRCPRGGRCCASGTRSISGARPTTSSARSWRRSRSAAWTPGGTARSRCSCRCS